MSTEQEIGTAQPQRPSIHSPVSELKLSIPRQKTTPAMCPTCSPVGELSAEVKQPGSSHHEEMVPLDQLLLSQRQTKQLQLENERLSSQLQDVVEMNVRWQRHDKRREAYVLRFHEANTELLRKVSSLQKTCSQLQRQQEEQPPPAAPAAAGRQRDVAVSTEGSEAAEVSPVPIGRDQLCALDGQIARNEKELATLRDTIGRLQAENKCLQRALARRQKEEDERLALYKEQLEVFVEDFRKERSDREAAHSQRIQLRKQLENTEATISRLRQEITDLVDENDWLRDRPTRVTHHYADRRVESSAPGLPPLRVNYIQYGRRPARDGQYAGQAAAMPGMTRLDGRSGYDIPDDSLLTVDGEPSGEAAEQETAADEGAAAASAPNDPRPGSLPRAEGVEGPPASPQRSLDADDWDKSAIFPGDERSGPPMRCPQCLVKFPVEEHGELLRHIQGCSQSR